MLSADRATNVYALREALTPLNRALALAEIHPDAVPTDLQIQLIRRRVRDGAIPSAKLGNRGLPLSPRGSR